LPLFVLGCSSSGGVKQNQSGPEKANGTPANLETTWSTVPTPSKITVYSEGKSRSVQTNNSKYLALAKEIETVLKNSNLGSAGMYQLALLNGDISGYRSRSGVELLYNSPFDLTINNSKKSIFRLFISCSEKPMLFVGTKDTDYYDAGPLVISNTNSLKQQVINLVNDATAKNYEILDVQESTIQAKQKASSFLKDKGYSIVSSDGKVEEYVLKKEHLMKLPYSQIWGVQQIDANDYLNKTIESFKFTVRNHPLDNLKGNNDKQTTVWVLVCENKAIGGTSLPDEDLVGGVYSLEGKTLEEVTGLNYQDWSREWTNKYK
jgi:hypothetical protein